MNAPIYALEVTFGSVMPRKGYSRVLQKDAKPAPISLHSPPGTAPRGHGNATTATTTNNNQTESYLWYSKDALSQQLPISNIRFVGREHGDELELQGFERLPRALFASSDFGYSQEELHVCVERDPACLRPICHLYIELTPPAGGSIDGEEEEEERVCIVPGLMYLCISRAADGDSVNLHLLEDEGEEDHHNLGGRTNWDLSIAELDVAVDRLHQALSQSTHEEIWLQTGWLNEFTRRCLSRRFRDSSVVPRVNAFLRLVLSKMCQEMRTLRGETLSSLLDLLADLLGDWRTSSATYAASHSNPPSSPASSSPSPSPTSSPPSLYYEVYGLGRAVDRSLAPSDLALDGYFVPVQRGGGVFGGLEHSVMGLGFTLLRQVSVGAALGGGAAVSVSELLLTNLNHFGTCGGWDALLSLIEERDEAARGFATLEQIVQCVTVLHNASYLANSDFALIYHVQSLRATHARLLSLAAADYQYLVSAGSIDIVDKAIRTVDAMVGKGGAVEQSYVDEARETFYMQFARQLLGSHYAGMGGRGARMLGELAAACNLRNVSATSFSSSMVATEPLANDGSSWLTSRRLLEFIINENIVPEMLGGVTDDPISAVTAAAKLRHDVLRNASGLMQFAARGGQLSPNLLAVLWIAASAHVSVSNGMAVESGVPKLALGLLATITTHLPLEALRQFSGQAALYLSPISASLQEQHVQLLGRILQRCASEFSNEADYSPDSSVFAPMDVLWDASVSCLEPEPAFDALLGVLKDDRASRLQATYVGRLLAVIEEDGVSLARRNVTMRILAELARDSTNKLSFSEKMCGVDAAVQSLAADLPRVSGQKKSTTAASGRLQCLELRTTLIAALAISASSRHDRVTLELHRLASLWGAVASADDANLTASLHRWLMNALPSARSDPTNNNLPGASTVLVEGSTAAALLDELALAQQSQEKGQRFPLGCEGLQPASLSLLQRLFCIVNEANGIISFDGAGEASVRTPRLIHLTLLIDTCARAGELKIQEAVAGFVAALMARLDEGVDRSGSWKEITSLLLQQLKDSDSVKDRVASRGLLAMLAALMIQVAKPRTMSRGALRTGSLQMTVFWGARPRPNAPTSRIYVFPNDSKLGAIRARLARDAECPPSFLELKAADRRELHFQDDDVIISAIDGTTIVDAIPHGSSTMPRDLGGAYKPHTPALETFELPEAPEMAPRVTAAHEENLPLLRSLLCGTDSELARMAWRVLRLLPAEGRLLSQISNECSEFFWVVHLGAGLPGYSLCLLGNLREVLLIERSHERVKAEEWRKTFVRAGGLHYLLHTWQEMPTSLLQQAGGLHYQCVACLALLVLRVSQSDRDGDLCLLPEVLDEAASARFAAFLFTTMLTTANRSRMDEDDEGDEDLHGVASSGDMAGGGTKALLIRTCASQIAAVVRSFPANASCLISPAHAPSLVAGLTNAASASRKVLRDSLVSLVKAVGGHEGREWLCQALVDTLRPSLQDDSLSEDGANCEQLFSLFSRVLGLLGPASAEIEAKKLVPLLAPLVTSTKGELHEEEENCLLRKRLELLCVALRAIKDGSADASVSSEAFVRRIFSDFLYPFASAAQAGPEAEASVVQIKAEKTREAALELLLLVSEGKEVLRELTSLVSSHHSLDSTASVFTGDEGGDQMPRSRLGSSGITNPGCVCYICSTLQILYMMPTVRQAILDIPSSHLAAVAKSGNADVEAIRKLQMLFVQLQEGAKSSVNVKEFCAALLDFDGQPTSLFDQQDASEFLFNLLQRLESVLMGTRQGTAIQEAVGGELLHELTAEGGLKSQRREPFFLLPLSIDKPEIQTLAQSLAACVEGETVNYSWEVPEPDESAPGKVVTRNLQSSKAMQLARLPRHLLLHLKRFAFNLQALQHFKIHKRFDFPLLVDMFPYTAEALEEKKAGKPPSKTQMYELAGVVVHSGVSTGGHYYAYVKEAGTGQWLEINDGWVGKFDVASLDEETFGGDLGPTSATPPPPPSTFSVYDTVASALGMDSSQRPASKPAQKQRSAFILVYNRLEAGVPATRVVPPNSERYKAHVPTPLADIVQRDNLRFLRGKQFSSLQYLNFCAQLFVKALPTEALPSPSQSIQEADSRLKAAATFAVGLLLRARISGRRSLREALQPVIASFFGSLATSLRTHASSCAWLLSTLADGTAPSQKSGGAASALESNNLLKLVLFGIDSGKEARAVMSIVCAAVSRLADEPTCEEFSSVLLRFLECIYNPAMLFEAKQHPRQISYFEPLEIAAKAAANHSLFAEARKELLPRALSFFLGPDSPFPELVGGSEVQQEMTASSSRPLTSVRLVRALSLFLTYSPEEISDAERVMLEAPAMIQRLVVHVVSAEDKALVFPILRRTMEDNMDASTRGVESLAQLLRRGGDGAKSIMRVAMVLLSIEDSLTVPRTHLLLDRLCAALRDSHRFIAPTEASLDMLLRMAKKWPEVREWLLVHAEGMDWAKSWLAARKAGLVPQGSVWRAPSQGEAAISNKNGFGTPGLLLTTLELLLVGRDMRADTFYDSDDDLDSLVGKRVKVRFSEARWYSGVVQAVRTERGEAIYTVRYDDGDTREHPNFPSERIWRLLV